MSDFRAVVPLRHVESRDNQSRSLAEHAERLRASTEAICRFSPGEPTFEEGRTVFTDYCDEIGFWTELPDGCQRDCDTYGDEHEVWFENEHVLKLTFPDFFGLKVIYRSDGDQRCLPYEYFERWQLHNEIFGDDVEILGAVRTPKGPRIVMRQKAIVGSPASLDQIRSFFSGNGWVRFQVNGETAWYDAGNVLVVSDTHPGNLILMPDGVLAPIDFRIQSVQGALLDAVERLCN